MASSSRSSCLTSPKKGAVIWNYERNKHFFLLSCFCWDILLHQEKKGTKIQKNSKTTSQILATQKIEGLSLEVTSLKNSDIY